MKIHKLSAYGLGAFVLTFGATLAFGQARVPFTRPPYLTTSGPISTESTITLGPDDKLCLNGPVCSSNIEGSADGWVRMRRNNQDYFRFSPSGLILSDFPHYFGSNIQSTVASGSQAFVCSNVGCRLSLGNTGRYLVDDGTNLEFVAPVQATSFEATNTTANAALFSGGSATNAMYFQSNATDAFTGSATGYDSAFVFKINENVSDTDIVFSVLAQNNTIPLYLQENGNLNARGNINAGQSGEFSSTAAVPIVIAGRQADGASSVGVALRTNSNLTTSGAKIVSVRNNVSTEVASIDKDGLLRVNAANAAKPTCNATNRGRVFYLDGAAGVADTYEICMKDASDVYAWETIVTP
jgi:hypothetical protein